MSVMEVGSENFDAEVKQSDLPVLVDFWAVWCGPCRAVAPVVEELSGEYAGKMKFCKLNVDDHGPLAAEFGIRSIPTLLIFKSGEPVDQIIGAVGKDVIKEKVDAALR